MKKLYIIDQQQYASMFTLMIGFNEKIFMQNMMTKVSVILQKNVTASIQLLEQNLIMLEEKKTLVHNKLL